MLETGNFIVPQVGSEPYLRKPPLGNWLVAASFKLFGCRNEWTARIPSVLCIFMVAVVFVTVGHRSLGSDGATIAALIWLTNLGTLEKGRLIEIEALYVSLCAVAMICWLTWWQQKRSPWLTWILPWVLVTPLIRFSRLRDDTERKLAWALAWSTGVPLIISNLIPGAAPRYSLPVLTPFCWLLGMVFAQDAFAQPAWLNQLGRPLWPRAARLFIGLTVAIGLIGFPVAAIASKHRQKVKNIADQINSVVPANETLYAVRRNYQPFF